MFGESLCIIYIMYMYRRPSASGCESFRDSASAIIYNVYGSAKTIYRRDMEPPVVLHWQFHYSEQFPSVSGDRNVCIIPRSDFLCTASYQQYNIIRVFTARVLIRLSRSPAVSLRYMMRLCNIGCNIIIIYKLRRDRRPPEPVRRRFTVTDLYDKIQACKDYA